ncbi:hypothetical protein G4B88_017107, partial [Cannabis sativa]
SPSSPISFSIRLAFLFTEDLLFLSYKTLTSLFLSLAAPVGSSGTAKPTSSLPYSSSLSGNSSLVSSLTSSAMQKNSERVMGRTTSQDGRITRVFFMATLILWLLSILFEIVFNKRSELICVVVGCFFFQLTNWVIRYFASPSRDPLFVNTSVSLLHSTIISSSVIFILVNQWLITRDSLSTSTWPCAYSALCFSCGYFAYDQLDMLKYRLYNDGWILVHHLILLVCFTLALYRNVTINYLILTLICELHSIFLHVRKVRRRMAPGLTKRSMFVRIEWLLNWVTYITARCAAHILITTKLIWDAPKFEKGVELPLALFGMAGMNLLNVFLGIDLFNAYRKEMIQPQNSNHHQE